MSDVVYSAVRQFMLDRFRDQVDTVRMPPLLHEGLTSSGWRWLPLVLVFGAIAAVAYADHLVVSISLAYLYILPLGVSAILLSEEISYSLIPACQNGSAAA